MHMADALISPTVGVTMWAVTAGLTAYSARKVQRDLDERKVPLMGVLGAFIFAAQMVNFSIPITGSSGHLGGGLILAILLGPYAGFLTMASVLTIQALFFADGGLLALGCNIFNLGFYSCFIIYPLIYKKNVRAKSTPGRIYWAAFLAGIIGLQLGAFSVVLETVFSGISDLPFKTFVWLMQPIHLGIGIIEGLVTTAVVSFIRKARPEILENTAVAKSSAKFSVKRVAIWLLVVTIFTSGVLSWFASKAPDGLEWSIFHTSGKEELQAHGNLHKSLAWVQEKVAFLPDYNFKPAGLARGVKTAAVKAPSRPNINGGTSFAGMIGAVLTLLMIGLVGFGLRFFRHRNA